MLSASELGPGDRLLYLVGVTTRWHVLLEHAARRVFMTLVAPTPAVFLASGGASQLLTDCRAMLDKAPVGEDMRAAGNLAINAALSVNQERNRLVHDLFLPSEDGLGWTAVRAPKRGQLGSESRSVTLADVEATTVRLQRCHVRISMLFWGLQADLPFYRAVSQMGPTREEALAYLRDEFELRDDGGTRLRPPHE